MYGSITVAEKLIDMSYVECLQDRSPARRVVARRDVYSIDPLYDPRWSEFVEKHPRASVFHSKAWLLSLARTYGYDPIAYTTSAPDEDLQNAIVFCQVNSWLTGRRLVSLPFSDHCEPLIDDPEDRRLIASVLGKQLRQRRWRYMEMRPLEPFNFGIATERTNITYSFHRLDLTPDLEMIFGNFHKNSTQRKVRRAQREGLKYFEGSSDSLLNDFYSLFKRTRRKHRIPPPPWKWFVNLLENFGEAAKIRIAYKGNEPVAAILTIRHKDTLVYKYGCSNPRFNRLGGVHFLMWKAIREAKAAKLNWIDFGRTDAGQEGLITFKNRWGAEQSVLTYLRYGDAEDSNHLGDLSAGTWKTRTAKFVLGHLPTPILSWTGRLLYKHVG